MPNNFINTKDFKTIKAIGFGSHTLVGFVCKKYPMDRGNCFSLVGEDGKDYQILNFNHENLVFAQQKGWINYPIDIYPVSEQHAYIHDIRIPESWYQTHVCKVCCPESLLPLSDQLQLDRQKKNGTITTSTSNNGGFTIVTYHIDIKQSEWEL